MSGFGTWWAAHLPNLRIIRNNPPAYREVVLTEQFKLLVAGCDCSVEDLLCMAGIGLGLKVGKETLGNAFGGIWLEPARLRRAFGPHLHQIIDYALTAIQLVKKVDKWFRPDVSRVFDAIVIHRTLNPVTIKRAGHNFIVLTKR